jgi:hypothetical protein
MLLDVLRWALVIALVASLDQAQATLRVQQPDVRADVDPQLSDVLQRAEHDFWTAAVHNDAAALDRIVAPEFTLHVAGMRQGSLPRAVWMDNTVNRLKAGTFQIRSTVVRKLGEDLAAVSQVTESRGTIGGQEQGCVCYGLDFWTRRSGAWQITVRYNIASDTRRERGTPPMPPPATDLDPQLTDTLGQLERELGEAAARGFTDTKQLDRLVAPEFTLRTSDEPEAGVARSSWVQAFVSYKVESFEQQYPAARKLADDLAVVSLLQTQQTSGDDRNRSGTFYLVDIWKRGDQGWQVIARYSGRTLLEPGI